MSATVTTTPDATTAVAAFVRFLETNVAPEGLFAPDVFGDISLPTWRLQAETAEELVAIRVGGHPVVGSVHVTRVEPTPRGFTMEFHERWEDGGQQWYCREMARADVVGSTIVELAIYCTGDWDEACVREHAAAVRLTRP